MENWPILPAAYLFLASPGLAAATQAEEPQTAEAAGEVAEAGPRATAVESQDGQADSDEIRCKRIAVTGSLVRKTKVCKTQAEWERISRRENDEARRMLDMNLEGSSTKGN